MGAPAPFSTHTTPMSASGRLSRGAPGLPAARTGLRPPPSGRHWRPCTGDLRPRGRECGLTNDL